MRWWQVKKRAADLERELRSDLELEEEERREGGQSPEEARNAARRAFGNTTLIREQTRETWGWTPFESFWQDIRYALRQLRRSPGFTLTVVLILALGIGAVTSVFSLVDATLLRPLPYKDGVRVMELTRTSPRFDHPVPVSGANFLDWRERSHTFNAMAAYGGTRMTRLGPSGPEIVHAMRVSSSFFSSVLEIAPEYGRDFRPFEDQPQNGRVVLLSHTVAEQWFGNARQAVGQDISLEGENFAVIGVLPKSFRFELSSNVDLWVPAVIRPGEHRGSNEWLVLGRLSPDVSLQRAQMEMNLIAGQLQKEFPKENEDQGIAIIPYLRWMNRGGNDRLVLIFFGAVLLVLLIAIANLAGLIVARSAARNKQMALHIALGASRTRLVRMLLTESLALSIMGGAAGVGIAYALTSIFRTKMSSIPLLRADLIHVDAPVLLFALVLSLGTGVLFGLGPALGASRPDLNSGLKEGGAGEVGRHSRSRTRSVLIVSEVALSLVLLASAGLLLRSMISALRTDPGYDPEHLLTFWLMPPEPRYPTADSLNRLYGQILENVNAIPGVQSAAISNTLPPMGNEVDGSFIVENHPPHDMRDTPNTVLDTISPMYFRAMGIRLIQGRLFTEQDNTPDASKVVIISHSLAQRYFAGEDPIGQHMKFDADAFAHVWVVVGVVADTRYFGWDHDDGVFSYFPYAALGGRDRIGIAVRTEINPTTVASSVEHAVWSVDGQLPLFDIAPMNRKLSDSFAPRRFNTALLGSFAGSAVFLAAIGIFGLLANLVARRTREIGVRMALGARREDVLRLMLAHSLSLTLSGICIGLPCALLAGKLLRGLLYNTRPMDPLMLLLAITVMFLVSGLASYLPARRAASIDPVQALRSE